MNIAVIIPFHKEKEKLEKCLAAVKASKIKTSDSGQFAHYIETFVEDDSDKENGFTKTVNDGIRKAMRKSGFSFEFALVLNQDCYLHEDAVQNLVSFMEDHPKCAIAGIKQLSSEDNDLIIHGGTRECYPAGVHDGGRVSEKACAKSKKVPWANGAVMMIRMFALEQAGLLDENMKMFGSDADISYTMRSRGWECWYCAEATGVHEQIASRMPNERMAKQLKLDMLYFKDKWISGELYEDLSLEILS